MSQMAVIPYRIINTCIKNNITFISYKELINNPFEVRYMYLEIEIKIPLTWSMCLCESLELCKFCFSTNVIILCWILELVRVYIFGILIIMFQNSTCYLQNNVEPYISGICNRVHVCYKVILESIKCIAIIIVAIPNEEMHLDNILVYF